MRDRLTHKYALFVGEGPDTDRGLLTTLRGFSCPHSLICPLQSSLRAGPQGLGSCGGGGS
jgi:hypothetical protein